jgi:lipoprotein-anchoring transpeptidase ErfK/SrfK
METISSGGRCAVSASPVRTALVLWTRRAFAQFRRGRSRVSIQFSISTLTLLLASCATHKDVQHRVVISVKDQRLAVLDRETLVAVYPVSTSKYGVGDWGRSYRTPLGELEVAQKIGDGMPVGTVFKDRRRTGEIVGINTPGRDPIVTRIIWLRGLELQNANAFRRDIYIHGTPEERNIGLPVSYGCVRMRSEDVIKLYDMVGRGARVSIVDQPLSAVVSGMGAAQSALTARSGITLH